MSKCQRAYLFVLVVVSTSLLFISIYQKEKTLFLGYVYKKDLVTKITKAPLDEVVYRDRSYNQVILFDRKKSIIHFQNVFVDNSLVYKNDFSLFSLVSTHFSNTYFHLNSFSKVSAANSRFDGSIFYLNHLPPCLTSTLRDLGATVLFNLNEKRECH